MNYILQRIDSDTAWFVIAVLVIALVVVLFWVIDLKMTIQANKREHRRSEDRRQHSEWKDQAIPEVDTQAYQREARHPDDSKPYDIRKL